ncbi:MAG TPA: sensor domain-containing diguanylate cyclase, partial [Chthonomonadaceae bacterium]|nr:sensor domain-containing diguanylate cyclase [Chthonomonadaceae bacterium]
MQRFYERTEQGLFQTHPDGRWLCVNPALARLYGYESSEALRRACPNRYHLDADPTYRETFLRAMQADGTVQRFEVSVRPRDGGVRWTAETVWAIRDETGGILCYEGIVEDITHAKQEEARLDLQAHHDSLTQLPNRKLFLKRLEETLALAGQEGRRVAVFFVDLDHFKKINDTLGHAAGDRLLQKLTALLKSCLSTDDTLARLGGDEFTAFLPEVASAEDAIGIAQQWLDLLAHPIPLIPGHELLATVSIGVSLFPDHGREAATLLRHADVAMYKAKQQGRNRFQLFSTSLHIREYERLIL